MKLLSRNVCPILEDKSGAVWIGTSNGLSVFKDDKFTNFKKENGLFSDGVYYERLLPDWVLIEK